MPDIASPLVECIPNFSEGRHPEVITQIAGAIASVEGIYLLDTSSDIDHNRTVITFAGAPGIIGEAAYRGIAKAAELIHMDTHKGVHPRIGATDVMPFVPLRDVTMQDCVEIARVLGQRVGDDLQIPVYLYEKAATIPERQNLAEVRRHPYEKLKNTIQSDPARKPDYGPSQLGTAGATAIGARAPLIAFNAYLNTDNREIAVDIARCVRESSGGLPSIKALGLLVKGQAQVSMNLIDFRQTSLFTILERVRKEAHQRGVEITHTELIGLVPQSALIQSALAYLQLPPGTHHLTLENRLGAQTNDFREITFE